MGCLCGTAEQLAAPQMENVVLSPIPLPDLVGEITRAVRSELDARGTTATPAEELLSRQQTAELLGVTLPTLASYTRRGLVQGYRIGARVRFKKNEVMDGLKRIRTAKQTRG